MRVETLQPMGIEFLAPNVILIDKKSSYKNNSYSCTNGNDFRNHRCRCAINRKNKNKFTNMQVLQQSYNINKKAYISSANITIIS